MVTDKKTYECPHTRYAALKLEDSFLKSNKAMIDPLEEIDDTWY